MRGFGASYSQQAMHPSMGMQPLTPMQAQMQQTQLQDTPSHSPMHLSEAERHHRREASFGNVLPARRPFEGSPMAQYQFNPHQVEPWSTKWGNQNPSSNEHQCIYAKHWAQICWASLSRHYLRWQIYLKVIWKLFCTIEAILRQFTCII